MQDLNEQQIEQSIKDELDKEEIEFLLLHTLWEYDLKATFGDE